MEVIMNTFANSKHHILVPLFGLFFGAVVYVLCLIFLGEGEYTFLFLNINRDILAKTLAFISFGLYSRFCYESPVLPNEQAIELFLGNQTGEVFSESNIIFVARPFWSIWKRVSIEHFSFTVASQNRTKEGHSMMVFATGRAVPENVQLLSKISQMGMQEQVLGLSMMAIGNYIRSNERNVLLNYQNWDISGIVQNIFGEHHFYGLAVKVFTTKVIEVNPETMRQFDLMARQTDMMTTLLVLTEKFPNASDIELYAMYASMMGITPSVMSYIVHGNSGNNMILGRGNG
jgi:hypothetical protein